MENVLITKKWGGGENQLGPRNAVRNIVLAVAAAAVAGRVRWKSIEEGGESERERDRESFKNRSRLSVVHAKI